MSFNVDGFFNELNTGNVVLAHKGSITTEVINGTLEEIEAKLDEIGESNKIKKKIYNVLVESLQNLYHHVDDMPDDLSTRLVNKFGILVISRDENHKYRISCGNFISSGKIKYLKDKIDKINSLSQDELKDMYKFILNHQKLSAKGGGGLGLVDIARKTGHKMEYSFMNHNNDYYFFNLDIFVS